MHLEKGQYSVFDGNLVRVDRRRSVSRNTALSSRRGCGTTSKHLVGKGNPALQTMAVLNLQTKFILLLNQVSEA